MEPLDQSKQGSLPPGLSFLCIKHDHGCPTRLNQDIADCICKELEYEFHSSPERFAPSVELGRKARRKAERDAAKALRKAARK